MIDLFGVVGGKLWKGKKRKLDMSGKKSNDIYALPFTLPVK
jgi:hypothetical protein